MFYSLKSLDDMRLIFWQLLTFITGFFHSYFKFFLPKLNSLFANSSARQTGNPDSPSLSDRMTHYVYTGRFWPLSRLPDWHATPSHDVVESLEIRLGAHVTRVQLVCCQIMVLGLFQFADQMEHRAEIHMR